MEKLEKRDGSSATFAQLGEKLRQTVSKCVLLKNVFDPLEETEEGWDLEIEEAMKEECVKYGNIVHIKCDRETEVY